MKFALTIECDNAAFDIEDDVSPGRSAQEAGRILFGLARQLQIWHEDGISLHPPSRGALCDSNGNRVGSWEVTE